MEIVAWFLPQRRDHIKELRESGSSQYEHQMLFQGQMMKFPVFNVDIGMPCYRLANGRTRAAQIEIVSTKSFPEEFFILDPDSEPALKEQHAILQQMVSEAGLMRLFKKVQQDRPLILSNDGYVVNGNRRLCAMRLLVEQDEGKFAHFKHVQVLFLPPATEKDIKELEGQLQVQPDVRADYSWTAEAMLYRDLRLGEWTDEQIADLYQKKVKEIRDIIAMLEDAEYYLSSRENSGRYSLLLKREFAFRQLQKSRHKCADDEPRRQLLTATAYLMLDDPDNAQGRLYESIPDALKYLDNVEGAIRSEFSEEVKNASSQSDDLDILGESQESSLEDIIRVISASENAEKARNVIRDTIEEMRTKERERKDATYCFRQVQQASTKLQSSLSALDEDADITGIEDSLKNIEQTISDIREWLSNVNNQD